MLIQCNVLKLNVHVMCFNLHVQSFYYENKQLFEHISTVTFINLFFKQNKNSLTLEHTHVH